MIFVFVCFFDDGDDWENDLLCWIKVNLFLGVIIIEEWLVVQVEQVRKMSGKCNGIV